MRQHPAHAMPPGGVCTMCVLETVIESQNDQDPAFRLGVFGYGWLFDFRPWGAGIGTHIPAWKTPLPGEVPPR